MARLLFVREVAALLAASDWTVIASAGRLRQFRHGHRRGAITLSGTDSVETPRGILRRVLQAAGFPQMGSGR